MRSFLITLLLLALFPTLTAELRVRDLNTIDDGKEQQDFLDKEEEEESDHYKPVLRARYLSSSSSPKSSKKSKTKDSKSSSKKSSKKSSSNDSPVFTSRRD